MGYQDNPARTFLGNNVEMFQSKSAETFQDKNVEMFPDKNANRFQKKNVETFLVKSVKKNAKISFGAKFAISLITSTNICKSIFSQIFYLLFGYLLLLYNKSSK